MLAIALTLFLQADAPHSSAFGSARPLECGLSDGFKAANPWERAKEPNLRRYCDLLASGTAKLEEAVVAYREALKESTRERVPLDWAKGFGNQGVVLMLLAERRRDAAMAKTALSQINTAFETTRDGGDARSAAFFEGQLPRARDLVTRLGKARSAR